jgi:hypothetical protein
MLGYLHEDLQAVPAADPYVGSVAYPMLTLAIGRLRVGLNVVQFNRNPAEPIAHAASSATIRQKRFGIL